MKTEPEARIEYECFIWELQSRAMRVKERGTEKQCREPWRQNSCLASILNSSTDVTVSKSSWREKGRRWLSSRASFDLLLPLVHFHPLRSSRPCTIKCLFPLLPSQAEVRRYALWCGFHPTSVSPQRSEGARDTGHGASWPQAIEPLGPSGVCLPVRLSE